MKEEEKTPRRFPPMLPPSPPRQVTFASNASPPPLPRGLLPYHDSDSSSMDDEDGPAENIDPCNVLQALSETLKVERQKRKHADGLNVALDHRPPRRLASNWSDVSYSSGNSSNEVSASSMSSESAHKQVKKDDVRTHHNQNLKAVIRAYDSLSGIF